MRRCRRWRRRRWCACRGPTLRPQPAACCLGERLVAELALALAEEAVAAVTATSVELHRPPVEQVLWWCVCMWHVQGRHRLSVCGCGCGWVHLVAVVAAGCVRATHTQRTPQPHTTRVVTTSRCAPATASATGCSSSWLLLLLLLQHWPPDCWPAGLAAAAAPCGCAVLARRPARPHTQTDHPRWCSCSHCCMLQLPRLVMWLIHKAGATDCFSKEGDWPPPRERQRFLSSCGGDRSGSALILRLVF